MPKQPTFTLRYNNKSEEWDLRNDKTGKVVRSFPTKDQATKRGALKRALGKQGGAIKIKRKDGKLDVERTFQGSGSSRKSKR